MVPSMSRPSILPLISLVHTLTDLETPATQLDSLLQLRKVNQRNGTISINCKWGNNRALAHSVFFQGGAENPLAVLQQSTSMKNLYRIVDTERT